MGLSSMTAEKETHTIAALLGVPHHHVCLVGSLLICGKGHDKDVLVLGYNNEPLVKAGFSPDLEACLYDGTKFTSWRKDDVNILLTGDPQYFAAEVAIAYAAWAVANHKFDMTERDGRVAFHSLVREKVAPHIEPEEAIELFL